MIDNGQKDKNGNTKLGENDQGSWAPPGGQITISNVTFWLMTNGEVRVVVDNRYGNNQGYFQENGGGKERLIGADLDEAISLATAHCADDEALIKACRIAASEARSTMRNIDNEKDGETESTENSHQQIKDAIDAWTAERNQCEEANILTVDARHASRLAPTLSYLFALRADLERLKAPKDVLHRVGEACQIAAGEARQNLRRISSDDAIDLPVLSANVPSDRPLAVVVARI